MHNNPHESTFMEDGVLIHMDDALSYGEIHALNLGLHLE